MKSIENITVLVTRNDVTEDLSEGTLALNFQSGVDAYEGLWQRPDVGQLTLVTRNPQFDPNVNPNIRFNTQIVIDELYVGYITDINVEYRPAGKPAIITINAVDAIGLAQRHLWTEEFAQFCRDSLPSFSGLGDALTLTDLSLALLDYADQTGKQEIPNFEIYTEEWIDSLDGTIFTYDNIPATVITAGENAWDTIVRLTQSNLSYISPLGIWTNNSGLLEQPYEKYTPEVYQGPPTWIDYTFSSEGNGLSYKNILIDDGYGRTVNQVKISNEDTAYTGAGTEFEQIDSTHGPYLSESSIEDWGSSELSIDTLLSGIYDVEATYERLSRDILESASNPNITVKELTFDGNKYPAAAFETNITNYSRVRVEHKVSDTFTIDRIFRVVGVKHDINESDWYVTIVLAEDMQYLMAEKTYSQPEIVINGTYDPYWEVNVGTSEFMWQASIANFPADKIESVAWNFYTVQNGALGGLNTGGPTHSTSVTPTWNYDDPNAYGIEGEQELADGYKTIRLTITTVDGWKVVAYKDILVRPDAPVPDFAYSRDPYGVYTFINTTITDPSPLDQTTWLWNFGDGTTSTLRNPATKTYATFGTYTVTLTASDWYGQTLTKTRDVVYNSAAADFTYTQSPTSWNSTSFTYTGSPALTYLWNFGNGQTSTLQNPSTIYLAPGTYAVSLTITDNLGTNTKVSNVTITAPRDEWGTLPVRYLKIAQDTFYYDYTFIGAGPRTMFMSNFQARKKDGTNRALDKNVTAISNLSGVLAQNSNNVTPYSSFADCYGTTIAGVHDQWNYATSPQRLTKADGTITTNSGVFTQSKWNSTQPGNCTDSRWWVNIDLGSPYNDLNNLRIKLSTLYTANTYALLTVYGSSDGLDWYKLGIIDPNGKASGGNAMWVTMTPLVTMPPNAGDHDNNPLWITQ